MRYLFVISLSFASVINTAGGKFTNGSHQVLYSIGDPIVLGASQIQNWVAVPVIEEKTSLLHSNIVKSNASVMELMADAQKVWVYSVSGVLLWESSNIQTGSSIPLYHQPTILRIQTKNGIFQSSVLEKNK